MQPLNEVRRTDRTVSDETWIRDILGRVPTGYLATVSDGQPFLNSNLFVYDKDAHVIYLHTARKGRTRSNVEREPRVCFTVSEMGRLLPADTALEFSVEYSSVVVFGRAEIVSDDAEATAALQKLLDKYFGHLEAGRDYRPPLEEELRRTTVVRVSIESWSGKKKEVGEFAGAFNYGDSPSKEK